MFSKDIKRRKKSGPSKLAKELVLYKLLYMDWKLRQDTSLADTDKHGVSASEIESFCQISPRMISRYLRELQDCKAIKSARKKGAYYLAEFDAYAPCDHLYKDNFGATTHLLKLSRTTTLMRKQLEKDNLPPINCLNSNVGTFFESLRDAQEWYENTACFDIDNPRTIQRDVRDVLDALKIVDKENFEEDVYCEKKRQQPSS